MSQRERMLSRNEAGVGYLIFNNPERHNAVSLAMWQETERMLAAFAADETVRVLVVTGAGGKAFVSGADVSKFENERADEEAVARYAATVERASLGLYEFPKPTIAMIRGYCLGGGVGLAVCCDLRICSSNARFAIPAARLGLGYPHGGLARLVHLVGPAFAKEMLFTARQFAADEAAAMGLVNRIVADAEIESHVRDLAAMIAANAPLTVEAAKYVVGELLKDADARDIAQCEARVKRCFDSDDYREGRRAFLEKRKPEFTGR